MGSYGCSRNGTINKLEVDIYLDEGCEKQDDFDILSWWKNNASKYKILSMVARDVLAIPVSSVASESAFSAGGRVLDKFRTSLTPKIVEALICTQDWICGPTKMEVEEELGDLEELESGYIFYFNYISYLMQLFLHFPII